MLIPQWAASRKIIKRKILVCKVEYKRGQLLWHSSKSAGYSYHRYITAVFTTQIVLMIVLKRQE